MIRQTCFASTRILSLDLLRLVPPVLLDATVSSTTPWFRNGRSSVTTMFRTYAAWMQGAAESDSKLIRSAMRAKKLASRLKPQRALIRASRQWPNWPLDWPLELSVLRKTPYFPAKSQWRRGWDSKVSPGARLCHGTRGSDTDRIRPRRAPLAWGGQ
jgi:hypothetical protein